MLFPRDKGTQGRRGSEVSPRALLLSHVILDLLANVRKGIGNTETKKLRFEEKRNLNKNTSLQGLNKNN